MTDRIVARQKQILLCEFVIDRSLWCALNQPAGLICLRSFLRKTPAGVL